MDGPKPFSKVNSVAPLNTFCCSSQSSTVHPAGAALDVSQGIYKQRWNLPGCGSSAILQSRRYAHRAHRSLLVWH
eukprot:SAG31_NODE_12582_length_931_cov_1.080529_1_plen_74_part_10